MAFEEMVKKLSERIAKFLEKECLMDKKYDELEKLWLCMEFPEHCYFKNTEWFGYSYELGIYEGKWIHFIVNEMKDIVPEECIIRPSLACEIGIGDVKWRVRDLIYESTLDFFLSRKDLCDELATKVIDSIGRISKHAKQLILVLYLDGDIVKDGKLVLCNTLLESIYMPTIRILFKEKVNEGDIHNAVDELVRTGLIAYCSWRSGVLKFNEYAIPPYLRYLWREIPKYLDIQLKMCDP